MSTITYNHNIGSLTRNAGLNTSAGLRVLICASLAMAITSLIAQVIGSATSATSVARASQPAQSYAAASLPSTTAALPSITVVAAR